MYQKVCILPNLINFHILDLKIDSRQLIMLKNERKRGNSDRNGQSSDEERGDTNDTIKSAVLSIVQF